MSLSENEHKKDEGVQESGQEWAPMDTSTLQKFDEGEIISPEERKKPNFNFFKVLYENPEIDEDDRFKRLYEPEADQVSQEEKLKEQFQQLFEEEPDPDPDQAQDSMPLDTETAEPEFHGDLHPPEPGPDDHGKGFQQGYEAGLQKGDEEGRKQGFEAGRQEGYNQGFEEGLVKGEAQGVEEGIEKGLVKGEADAADKAVGMLASLENLLERTDQVWQQLVRENEMEILSMICKVAEKVIQARVELDEGVVRESVLQAISLIPEPQEITLHVSPEDYEYVEMIKEDFFEKVESLSRVSVMSNPALSRGGCKIETVKATVETDLASRLDLVKQSILGAWES